MPRCKNGTRRNKKTGNCESRKVSSHSKTRHSSLKPKRLLTKNEIDTLVNELLNMYCISSYDQKSDIKYTISNLHLLKYDPNYVSDFSGKKEDPHQQVMDKLYSYWKGDTDLIW